MAESENMVFYVSSEDVGTRLDVFLAANIEDVSRSYIKNLIDGGAASVNGVFGLKSGTSLKEGDEVIVSYEPPKSIDLTPCDIQLDIIYEDSDMVIVNKQQGLVTHPCNSTPSGTLVNALLYRIDNLSGINGVIRPGIVHRLDKNTSGLIVVAKNNNAHRSLAKQIELKEAKRIYVALVDGVMKHDEGIIDKALGRSVRDHRLVVIDPKGRQAVTHYRVLERFDRYTYVEFELKTGRTHQIRVHSKCIGHTVVGDELYGGTNRFDLKGQLLHAIKLVLNHPSTGERMEFYAPLPPYFEAVLEKLRK